MVTHEMGFMGYIYSVRLHLFDHPFEDEGVLPIPDGYCVLKHPCKSQAVKVSNPAQSCCRNACRNWGPFPNQY